MALYSADGSTVTGATRYDAYGLSLGSYPSATSPDPWGYQDRLALSPDPSHPLYDFAARSYDPGLGAFTSLDSLQADPANPLSLNRFLYAGGNPTTYVDPSGHLVLAGATTDQSGSLATSTSTPTPAPTPSAPAASSPATTALSGPAPAPAPCVPGQPDCSAPLPQSPDLAFLTDLGHHAGGAWPTSGSCFFQGRGIFGCLNYDYIATSSNLDAQVARFLGLGPTATANGSALKLDMIFVLPGPGLVEGAGAIGSVGDETSAVAGGQAVRVLVGTSEGGYASFRAAKLGMGPAGDGMVYDHIVEQSQIERTGFLPTQIHNPGNLNAVLREVNQIKANFYSSIQDISYPLRVRDWLSGQSFEEQWTFGMRVTEQILRGEIP